MSFDPLPLLPDDAQITAQQELDAAVQSAQTLPSTPTPVPEAGPQPIGRSWLFDFEAGEFVRQGGAPARTSDLDTLKQWCLMAIHTARYSSAVFSDEFGMEGSDDPFGELVAGEMIADYQRHLIEALVVHDRITSVENVQLTWDPSQGVMSIDSMDVITDEDQSVAVDSVQVTIGGAQ